jgi:hypothetical protein
VGDATRAVADYPAPRTAQNSNVHHHKFAFMKIATTDAGCRGRSLMLESGTRVWTLSFHHEKSAEAYGGARYLRRRWRTIGQGTAHRVYRGRYNTLHAPYNHYKLFA